MEIAGYSVQSYIATNFALDGGAMFGSVPKVLWQRKIEADNQNRIPLVSRILVLTKADRQILVDVGCGRKWSEKQQEIYSFVYPSEKKLHEVFPKVTDVVITHLHFDHGGGLTYYDQQGDVRLSFPKARHYVQQANWDVACAPGVREQATYLEENVAPLKNVDLLLTRDAQEILPGITVHRANGHTQGLQWLTLTDGEQTLACPSELIPTAHHIGLPWVMGYDLCAETTLKEKAAFLEAAIENEWTVFFGHDADTAAVKIGRDERGRAMVKESVDIGSYSSARD
jgi:glyoxylase-like metal-dependent hydrolase (beta-lactamase superfamily II)